MTVAVCSYCGAEASVGNAACRDCRLAPNPSAAPTLPDDESSPEVAFELDDWPADERVSLGVTLTDRAVPWRWEPGPVLVVREFDEALVEQLLDDAEGADPEWENLEGEQADEEGQSAMSDLFDIADRLTHAPWNAELIADVDRLGTVVDETDPPFGVEPEVWDEIGSLTDAVLGAADEADEAGVEEAARALREYLRRYV